MIDDATFFLPVRDLAAEDRVHRLAFQRLTELFSPGTWGYPMAP